PVQFPSMTSLPLTWEPVGLEGMLPRLDANLELGSLGEGRPQLAITPPYPPGAGAAGPSTGCCSTGSPRPPSRTSSTGSARQSRTRPSPAVRYRLSVMKEMSRQMRPDTASPTRLSPPNWSCDDGPMSAPPLRVMLVDDHEVVRDGIKLLLADTADVVVCAEAGSAREAVAVAAQAL